MYSVVSDWGINTVSGRAIVWLILSLIPCFTSYEQQGVAGDIFIYIYIFYLYILFIYIFFHFETYIQSVLIRLKPETAYVLDFRYLLFYLTTV